MKSKIAFLLFAILVLTINTHLAFAQTPNSTPDSSHGSNPDPDKLKQLSGQQKQAEEQAKQLSKRQKQILSEIETLQDDLVQTSRKARGYEVQAAQYREKLNELEAEERQLKAQTFKDRETLSDFLAALQRIEKNPPPSLMMHPDNAVNAAQAAQLLAHLSTDIREKTEVLQSQLEKLQTVQSKISTNQIAMTRSSKAAGEKLGHIKSVLNTKADLSSQLDKDRLSKIREAEKLAAEAKNLRALIAKFEEQAANVAPRRKPTGNKGEPSPRLKPKRGASQSARYTPPTYVPTGSGRFSDARGQLPLPVVGRLSRRYGARLAGGGTSKGLSLKSAAGAQVVAPFAGRVEFSGSFNNDHVVILNTGGGYFIVLTGLGETLTETGTSVKAGEPLGIMPRTANRPELFMEFRKNRNSINPMPWVGTALARSKNG